jgi:hypothetical protein
MAVALNGTRLPLLKVMAETLRYIKGEALREVSKAWHVPVTNDKVRQRSARPCSRALRQRRALTSQPARAAGALGRDGARRVARRGQELHAQGGARGWVRGRWRSRIRSPSRQAARDTDAAVRARASTQLDPGVQLGQSGAGA